MEESALVTRQDGLGLALLEETHRTGFAEEDLTSHDSDILHPNRANISKDELRAKLAELYKANKDQVNVFGLRTQFGGGKTTGFALVYDSPEALKKFEPHYRLVRVGFASKIEKPSRQQRTSIPRTIYRRSEMIVRNYADIWGLQASNARTDKRPSEVRPRSRVQARRRTNRRLAFFVVYGGCRNGRGWYRETGYVLLSIISCLGYKGTTSGHDGMNFDRPFRTDL